MPWRSSALFAPLVLAACMTPRHEVFVPAPELAGWEAVPAEGTASIEQAGAVLRVRLTEDENACLQAVLSFTVEQGELTVDFSAARVIAGGRGLAPVKIEHRRLVASPELQTQPPPLESIGPVQTIHPGAPGMAMGGFYLLAFAIPVREAREVTLQLPEIAIGGRRMTLPPASFVAQGVTRTKSKRCPT